MISDANTRFSLNRPVNFGLIFITSIIYFVSVVLLLRDYASIEWTIYRIHYDSIEYWDNLIAIIYILIPSLLIKNKINDVPSLFITIVYIFIYIPSGVCLLAMDSGNGINRYVTIFLMIISFSFSIFFTRPNIDFDFEKVRLPSKSLSPTISIVSLIVLIFLYYRFGSIMSFVALDDLYEQRALGAANNFIEGYAQTYSQYVFSTGLFALGLYQRKMIYIVLGIFGSLTNFAITAEKAGLMYPIFIFLLFSALNSKRDIFYSIYFILLVISFIMIFSIYTRNIFEFSEFISWYFGTRSILTPGLFITYYTDFFFERGYTYFSHIRGFNLFISVPVAYVSDPRWPLIGIMVGEDFIGYARLNANASFVASDGIASIGTIGIFVAFLIFSVIVKMFEHFGRCIPIQLLLPLLLSIALTLTNGSALSVLTSTGGLFWMIMLKFAFPQNSTGSSQPRS